MTLVTCIYKNTKKFPREELFTLVSQMRRAAISIPSNIAEGYARYSINELIRFLYIALGSNAELETQLMIARNLEYIEEQDYNELITLAEEIRKMLISLIKNKETRK